MELENTVTRRSYLSTNTSTTVDVEPSEISVAWINIMGKSVHLGLTDTELLRDQLTEIIDEYMSRPDDVGLGAALAAVPKDPEFETPLLDLDQLGTIIRAYLKAATR